MQILAIEIKQLLSSAVFGYFFKKKKKNTNTCYEPFMTIQSLKHRHAINLQITVLYRVYLQIAPDN